MDNNIAVPTAVTTNKTIRPIKKGTLIDWGVIFDPGLHMHSLEITIGYL